jgi:hypothetical protein
MKGEQISKSKENIINLLCYIKESNPLSNIILTIIIIFKLFGVFAISHDINTTERIFKNFTFADSFIYSKRLLNIKYTTICIFFYFLITIPLIFLFLIYKRIIKSNKYFLKILNFVFIIIILFSQNLIDWLLSAILINYVKPDMINAIPDNLNILIQIQDSLKLNHLIIICINVLFIIIINTVVFLFIKIINEPWISSKSVFKLNDSNFYISFNF